MPVDFVDRLEEQLREAAAVPPAVRRRQRLVAAARPTATLAATAALAAGAVGAVAVAAGDDAGTGATAAGEGPLPTAVTERPPVPRPAPNPLPPDATVPIQPAPPTTPEDPRTVPLPSAPTAPEAAPPPGPRPAVPAPARTTPPPTVLRPGPVPTPRRPGATTPTPATPVPAPRGPGTTSPTPAAPGPPAPVPLIPAAAPPVAVLNGTTSPGAARRVAGLIGALGYRGLPSGNAAVSDAARTTLYAREGSVTEARALSSTLGIRNPVVLMTPQVAALSPRAGIVVVLGRTPAPPREATSLRLTGPGGARGVASFVLRGDGTVALSLRQSRVPTGRRLTAWIPGGSGWLRLGEFPASASAAHVAVLAPVGRRLPEGFLLSAERPGTAPSRPGRTVLTSKR